MASFAAAVFAGAGVAPGLRSTSSLRSWSRCCRAPLWAGIAGVLKVTRGVSEVISTIMLNAIAVALVGYLLSKVGSTRADDVTTDQADPRGQLAAGIALVRRPRRRDLRRWRCWRSLAGIGFCGRCSTAPGSASTCARPGSPRPPRSRAGVNVKRMVVISMLLSGAHRRPDRHARAVRRRRTPTARPSRPVSASPASRWRCWAATTRSASPSARCSSPSSTSRPTRSRSWPTSRPTSSQITQGVIVLAVVVAYEVVRRYRVAAEQREVGRAEPRRRRPRRCRHERRLPSRTGAQRRRPAPRPPAASWLASPRRCVARACRSCGWSPAPTTSTRRARCARRSSPRCRSRWPASAGCGPSAPAWSTSASRA